MRTGDHADRHVPPPSLVRVDEYDLAVHAGKPASDEPLTLERLAQDQLRPPSREAAVIVDAPQRSIESRRRNLERVRRRHDVLDVEHRAQVAAHVGAILDADALVRRRRRTRPIDPHAQHHAGGFAAELDVEDLQPVTAGHTGGRLPHLLDHIPRSHTAP